MRQLLALSLAVFSLLNSALIHSDSAFSKRHDVRHFIDTMVKKYRFNRQELTLVMQHVQLQPQIIESMNKPYEKKSWDVYKQLFLTPQRVQAGVEFWRANQNLLIQAEKKYQVPANIIVAILGIETLYGQNQGNYRVLDALATLAFNYPKRQAFFIKELEEYLILCREHQVSPTQYLGSYAGAMGKPQFMPSSYRYYAANFNNAPKKDLMHDNAAVIASVANYFHKHGWKMQQSIAQPAIATRTSHRQIDTRPKMAVYRLSQLAAAGVKPLTAATNAGSKVGLIELKTQTGEELWLTYPNFYVITRYNTSPQYALVVYLLSQQLKSQWSNRTTSKKPVYA